MRAIRPRRLSVPRENARQNPQPQQGVPFGVVRRPLPQPSSVYQTFWHFACERQAVFDRRVAGEPSPWTQDPILRAHRFTNAYRASDRVSQYLIRHVIYAPSLPQDPREVIFRILLFKLFNRIDTWELLNTRFGPLTVDSFRFEDFAAHLTLAQASGQRLYSAAYIMPSTGPLGESVKHRGHLRLVERMVRDRVDARITSASSLSKVYEVLLSYPTLGPFLAFQLTIDINYADVIEFLEMDFVVAGPGALDGLHKCFASFGGYTAAEVIRWVTERQEEDPAKLGLTFPKLFGRPLQLIDVQNLFCEVSKYARVAHPDVAGVNGRSRIKQMYRAALPRPHLFYPPKWGLNPLIPADVRAMPAEPGHTGNGSLFGNL